MRCLWIVLFALVVFTGTGAEKVLMWEASAPNLPGKVYLAGSIHVGKAQWYPLDKTYDRTLRESSAVYFEVFKPDPAAAGQTALKFGMFQDGKKLADVLGYADYQTAMIFFSKNSPQLSSPVLERLRPWLLGVEVASIYLRSHPQYDAQYGLETVFTANLGSKPGYSLESVDSQFKAMSDVSDAAAGRVLMESIREFDNAGRDLERIMSSLEKGTLENLTLLTNEIAFKHPEYYRHLFQERNRKLADTIFEMLRKKQVVLVLIGAGHFAGKGSIPECLRNKGCRLIQLDRTGEKGKLLPR